MAGTLQDRVRFDFIRYANCWEDTDLLIEALRPAPGRRILSIASGGDNSLALAAAGAHVVSADLNPAQLACVALKVEAIRRLNHDGVLAFLGIRPSSDRLGVYARLRPSLPPSAAAFWDAHPELIASGLVHAGKFERYFQVFRRYVLPFAHGRRRIADLVTPKTDAARRSFYDRQWNNVRWRLIFRVFFSRVVMGRLGRDPEFFKYVEGSVAERILARARYALTELPIHTNPYLDYILTGNFTQALPPYLEPARFEALRAGLDRLTLFEGTVQDAADAHAGDGFDGYNLSDIFEYLEPAVCAAIFRRLQDRARPGARFAYWNMLAERTHPSELGATIEALPELSTRLFRKDRACFYSAFVVEETRQKQMPLTVDA